MSNKMLSCRFASFKKKKKQKQAEQSFQFGKHTNVERTCPRLATMQVYHLVKLCRASQDASCAEAASVP